MDLSEADSSGPSDNVYEVEAIVGHKHISSGILFKVRWAGYGEEDDTWETEENLDNCSAILDDYIATHIEPEFTEPQFVESESDSESAYSGHFI